MMNQSNFNEIDATYPFRSRKSSNPSIFVKDANLQIHVPSPQDAADLGKTHTFKNVFAQYLEEVNTLQHESDAQIQRLVAGETENLHEVMLAMDEAKTAFDLMMQVRNQLVKSYEQLTRGG